MEQQIIIQNFANPKDLVSMMAEELFTKHIKPFLKKMKRKRSWFISPKERHPKNLDAIWQC
jgi:hypothetical protein